MLQLATLEKQYGSKILFAGASLHVRPGERIGLVGPNGSGKTTLLRLIAREEEVDKGQIILAKGTTVGYLKQDITEKAAPTLIEEVLRGFPEIAAREQQLIRLEEELAVHPHDQQLLNQYGRLQQSFEVMGGYAIESRARAILSGVGFASETHRAPLRHFSGGWMMRVAIARLLLQQPRLLLMDEPTNHLDLDSIIWLENFLREYPGTVMLISHDQYFLNRVVTRIVEISRADLHSYPGSYDEYRHEKAARQEILLAEQRSQEKQIAQTEQFIERFRYKATKARQVQSRIKMLEKLERVSVPDETAPQLRFRFPQPVRGAAVVAELEDVVKNYGEKIVYHDLHLTITRGQRIALVGHNGAGKSTLLKILAGVVDIQGGRCTIGQHVTTYYYAQHQLDVLDADNTILEELALAAPSHPEQWLRQLAGTFLFPGDEVFKTIGVLSGGEKARVALAKMLAKPANFFILDEPTNHLDIQARQILEEAIRDYTGTFILISHDRQFINAVASTVVEVDNGNLKIYSGDYEYYLWKKEQERLSSQPESRGQTVNPGASENLQTGNPNKKDERRLKAQRLQERQRRLQPLQNALEHLETIIAALEKEKSALTEEICDPAVMVDNQLYAQKLERLGSVTKELEGHYEEWTRVSETLESETRQIDIEERL